MRTWEGCAYMMGPAKPGCTLGRQLRNRMSETVQVEAETRDEAERLIRQKLTGKAAGRAVSARPV